MRSPIQGTVIPFEIRVHIKRGQPFPSAHFLLELPLLTCDEYLNIHLKPDLDTVETCTVVNGPMTACTAYAILKSPP